MTGIWTNDSERWKLVQPEGFPDEATLHRLIAETPNMLPLAGSPDLVVLASEAQLGTGYADLLAVETTGRPVIVEVKLASNAEARRAVVAQLLAYAARLHGMTVLQLEEGPLHRSLHEAGHATILDAVASQDQEGAVNAEVFNAALEAHLLEGRFRLVLVLDDAPEELVTLVAYLEHVTADLQIDVVTVSSFAVNGTQVVLPQRVTPERHAVVVEQTRAKRPSTGTLYGGDDEFETSIAGAGAKEQIALRRLLSWARQLAARENARLFTYRGSGGRVTLLPYLLDEKAGFVTIWNDRNTAYVSLWRSVFERKAPGSIEVIEELVKPGRLGQGTSTMAFGDELLEALAEAYRIAAEQDK
jgi:hypothetical protein